MNTPEQPECVECTEHEMICEGSIHQIKAMNCRVKPLDPVFFDTTAPEQPEWEKTLDMWIEKDPDALLRHYIQSLKMIIPKLLTSRDAYWKEVVRKEVEGMRMTRIQWAGTTDEQKNALLAIFDAHNQALDTLLDNLK